MADQLGFARATDDWRALVADPAVRARLDHHAEPVASGDGAGGDRGGQARLVREAAGADPGGGRGDGGGGRGRRVRTMVGYNYVRNPAFAHARRLVEDGVIGRPMHFRGFVDEDYQADPDLPWTWRARIGEAGLGALGDLGCHLVSMAYGLLGPIESLVAEMATVYPTRPLPDGSEEAGRERGRGERAGPLRERRPGADLDLAHRLGAEEPARVGAARDARHAGLRAGADERAAAFRQRGAGGDCRASAPS